MDGIILKGLLSLAIISNLVFPIQTHDSNSRTNIQAIVSEVRTNSPDSSGSQLTYEPDSLDFGTISIGNCR